jgi:hypothetical protein
MTSKFGARLSIHHSFTTCRFTQNCKKYCPSLASLHHPLGLALPFAIFIIATVELINFRCVPRCDVIALVILLFLPLST